MTPARDQSPGVEASARLARRRIRRWARRIAALATDQDEPAWAPKAAILAGQIQDVARMHARDVCQTGGLR